MLVLTTDGKFVVETVTIREADIRKFRFKPGPGSDKFELYQAMKHITGED